MAFLAIPWIGLLAVGLAVTGARYGPEQGYWAMLLHVYLVWQVVNFFDLIVFDWGGMQLIDPRHPPFPGTENAPRLPELPVPLLGVSEGQHTRPPHGVPRHEFTVHDPEVWSRPWTASIPMVLNDQPMYEYGCHEGNYSLPNMLAGARA